jgi:plasmid maintenance system antidote protein VapI
VQTAFETQKQVAQNLNLPQNQQVSELVARQTAEMTSNVIRAFGTFNQLSINAIDAARENTKIFNRTIDAVTDFNTNIVKAWTSYWASQQQQFTRAY